MHSISGRDRSHCLATQRTPDSQPPPFCPAFHYALSKLKPNLCRQLSRYRLAHLTPLFLLLPPPPASDASFLFPVTHVVLVLPSSHRPLIQQDNKTDTTASVTRPLKRESCGDSCPPSSSHSLCACMCFLLSLRVTGTGDSSTGLYSVHV